MLIDASNRKIDYLRLSVTDSCNLGCVYCLPESAPRFPDSTELLRRDEILRLVSSLVDLGISKIRVTGGEPLVRPDVCELVREMSLIPGLDDISLSTNGILLARFAEKLREAGLKRINISLDTLDPGKFERITRFGKLRSALSGIEAAIETGLSPVKLNVVVARGINNDEIEDFVRLTECAPVHVRFIELMPMGETGFFSEERRVPLEEMMEAAFPLRRASASELPVGHGPASYYKRPGAKGTVGFISALSRQFCGSCNRVRLSSQGILIPCLDSMEGADLGRAMRDGACREEIEALILRAIEQKPEAHTMKERISGFSTRSPLMCRIGG